MRATDGGRVIPLPAWVSVRAPLAGETARVTCSRCDRATELVGTKREAEGALGRFAKQHAKCQDPEAIRAAVRAAEESHRSREEWEAVKRQRQTGVRIMHVPRKGWGE